MQIKTSLIFVVFVSLVFSCSKNYEEPILAQIIPIPVSQTVQEGHFLLTTKTGLSFDDEFSVAGNFLKNYIETGSSFQLKQGRTIVFEKDEAIKSDAGYLLEVTPKRIVIKAKTDQGAFYAVQTLRQLLPVSLENSTFSGKEIAIQCLTIQDEPQYLYRGMHLDVARHKFSVAFIKKYIDALAMLKINRFHWHLTDDQGWRIEIKKYPKLQEVAAFRKQTLMGHFSDKPSVYDGKRYGGFYTQDQIKNVVAYAEKKFVTVIPEIEMPGHAQAAIAAYPELGCTGNPVKVAEDWGVFENIFCAGKEYTFKFLEHVLDEVIPLFPSKYIHIGGDEAPKTQWKTCQACQKRIKNEGLKDEHELQSYFIHRIEKYLNSKGKQIIGWDEILEGGLAPNATVMSWRGIGGAVQAAKSKHDVIMTPTSHCYFDYYQSTNTNEPLAIGGFLPLEKVYGFNPIPMGLSESEASFILGAQGNLWTEYISDSKQVEYMVFPRILALSEVLWSKPETKNYHDFINSLERFHKRMDALEINYANHLYEVEGFLDVGNKQTNYQLQTITQNKIIRYTLDGSRPKTSSKIYTSGIPITKSETIKAAVFNQDKLLGTTFTQRINYHKAIGHKIRLNVQPHHAYTGSGPNGLINGISGSDSRYGDKEWLGFWGEDVIITIDLEKETTINSISTRFYNGNGQWIYAPTELEIEFDDTVEKQTIKVPNSKEKLVDIVLNKKVKTRFIKLKIPNYGIIPEGKQGAGNPAWTFIDEISIK